MINITYKGKEYKYEDGTAFLQMLPDMEPDTGRQIVLAKFRGKLIELFKVPKGDGEVEFITTYDVNTKGMARRAVHNLLHNLKKEHYQKGLIIIGGTIVEKESVVAPKL